MPGAVSGVDPGRPVDRMFQSVPGLRALSAALSLFVFPAESCHWPSLPPAVTLPHQECKHLEDTSTCSVCVLYACVHAQTTFCYIVFTT